MCVGVASHSGCTCAYDYIQTYSKVHVAQELAMDGEGVERVEGGGTKRECWSILSPLCDDCTWLRLVMVPVVVASESNTSLSLAISLYM